MADAWTRAAVEGTSSQEEVLQETQAEPSTPSALAALTPDLQCRSLGMARCIKVQLETAADGERHDRPLQPGSASTVLPTEVERSADGDTPKPFL